ncbi:MAG TPA: hypothetical protein VFO76_03520, partial [Candidatus Kapabacteria bacterium]|nr:hypothetical protein [Candidatus Kapabacteria bacterium]
VWEHKFGTQKSFTHQYHINKLVYFEKFSDVHLAITRETQLKDYRREKKIALIEGMNKPWIDLAADWYSKSVVVTDSSLRSE